MSPHRRFALPRSISLGASRGGNPRQRELRIEHLEARLALAADLEQLLSPASGSLLSTTIPEIYDVPGKPDTSGEITPPVVTKTEVTKTIVPGEIIIALTGERDVSEVRNRLSNSLNLARLDLGGSVRVQHLFTVGEEASERQSLFRLQLGAGQDVAAVGRVIHHLADVAWTQPNYAYHGMVKEFIPNDPLYPLQYHHALLENPAAWDTTLGVPQIVVAVTDDGMQLNHPDLAGKLYVNIAEIPNLIDDDGNGMVDDVSGWDFVSWDNDPSPVALSDDHGTHAAGIIAATANNGMGVAGIASNVKIMPLRIIGADGGFTSLILAQSFVYAADSGANIVSTGYNIDSFVGDGLFDLGLQYLYDRNVLHFSAAGNSNELNPPRQAFHQTLLVASTGPSDMRSATSNFGTGIDISAPGENILSTVTANGYSQYSGTSVAAPVAAGVAALIWSANPSLTRDQVAARLVGTATDISAQNPTFTGLLGSGRVNSYDALTAPLAAPRINRLREVPTTLNPSIFPITRLTVSLASVFNKGTVEAANNWRLVSAGLDGALGTADDQPVALTRSTPYMVGANEVTFTFPLLATGQYRFTAVAGGLRDPFGTELDGDSNGVAGGNFIKDFRVITGTPVFVADFSDDFGAPSADGFTTAGPFNLWHLSTGRGNDPGHSADDSAYFGFGETIAGGGAYLDDSAGALFSPLIDLTTYTAPVSLQFNHFLQSEAGFDFAIVSVIDGAITTDIAVSGSTFPHNTVGFETVALDLSAYAGRSIRLQFTFIADYVVTEEGWYVDDVTVLATSGGSTTTIAGNVFHDLDSNGTLDPGEPGLGGWTTYIDLNGNGQLDNNLPLIVASTDTPMTIFDSRVITSFLTVSGVSGVISDLDVLVNIDHTFNEDLDVFLITPGGSRIELFTDVGGSLDNFRNTILDDEAPELIRFSTAPFTGSYRPEGLLSMVDGLSPNGVWRLEITDDHAPDSGILRNWSLNFVTSEPTAITDFSGNYQFAGLLPGTYTIREVVQPNYLQTGPPGGGYTVTVDAGQFAPNNNFGNALIPTEIRGTVWNDLNGNRIREGGENGLAGWTVYLDENNSGVFDSLTINTPSTDVPKSILDFATITSQTIVSGVSGTLLDLDVSLSIVHTWNGDLDIFLISPTGVRVELTTDNGPATANFTNTRFDDEAAISITAGVAPYTGSFQPEGLLSALDGISPNGIWRLEITDDAGADQGALTAWSLHMSVAESSTTTSATGEYVFDGLNPGNYIVREVVQPTWTQVLPVSGFHVATVFTSQTTAGQDFANTQGNSLPLISNLPDQTLLEDASAVVNFTVNDQETPVDLLTISAATSDPALLPLSGIVFGGSLGDRTVTLTPAADQFGTVTVTITVTDANGATAQDTLLVTVTPVNDAPTFVSGSNPTVNINSGAQSVPNWATLIAPGPANESGQSINFVITNNTNTGLFAVPPAVAADGTLTFTPAAGLAGFATITLVLQDNGGTAAGGVDTSAPQTFVITVGAATLQVSNVTPTTTGFIVDFNSDLDPATLNLYDTQGGGIGPIDITFVGVASGNIRGSAVVDPSLRRLQFIRTTGRLEPDTYTLTLRSGADGFTSPTLGILDGDANGVEGGNFVQSFSVNPLAAGTVTVSLPNFSRGPNQTVNVPGEVASGIPVSVSDGTGVTSVSFQLNYSPALLSITGATVAPSMPAGASVSINTSTPGVAIVQFSSPTAINAGAVRFVDLQAVVPGTAPYKTKQVLDLSNVVINSGNIPSIDDDALQIAAYFGDVTANGTYSALDASRISRVAVGLDGGFMPFRLLDPVIIGDITGNGFSAADTAKMLQAAVAEVVPEVPALPTPAVSLIAGGPDPKLSIPTDLVAAPGNALIIPVMIDSIVDLTGTGLESADLVVYYDAAALDLTGVQAGSLLASSGGNWAVAARIDPLAGRVFISLAGTVPLEGFFLGELVTLHGTVKETAAAGEVALNLAAGSRDPSRFTQLNEGFLTLIPAPTDAANDPGVDGLLTIVPAAGTTANPTPAAQMLNGQLLITGTNGDDRLIVGRYGLDQVRVRSGSQLLGDFPIPSGIAIDSRAGNDYVVVAANLRTAIAATADDVIFAGSQTAILNSSSGSTGQAGSGPFAGSWELDAQDEALLQILAGWNDESSASLPISPAGRWLRFARR